ncbi:MAG: NAD-dependent deacylase [Bacteroidetes bacterium]|nr:NAD-dependent deacylase [Bacteroidota bacterium]MBU1579199.1 NAD-dependent deacylase [Bacteroidota bacterium]MBU2556529.1 NAD-dependent deacylase [Bacteroidota bacterium]
MTKQIEEAAKAIKNASHAIAFTGAGISAESGIPPFRGKGGIWNTYDPIVLDLDYFFSHYTKSWKAIKSIFYDFLEDKHPNAAHIILAEWEKQSILKGIITQNIDNLHQDAGSLNVIEFHGNAQRLICADCAHIFEVRDWVFTELAPYCPNCGGRLKPDFVFFGEAIPEQAYRKAYEASTTCDLMIIIGASGEVSPANKMPQIAKNNHSAILEINPDSTLYTNQITTISIKGSASEVLSEINRLLNIEANK